VLKCGGGKALTKQPSEETALKCHATIEDAGKVGEVNALMIYEAPVNPLLEDKFEVHLSKNRIKKMRLGKITPELYNLEDNTESEKPKKIELDLDLYQMEEV
jgi:hypothetical protein